VTAVPKRPLTIVAVNKFHAPTGGADTFYLKLNRALRRRGHRVVEFSTHHRGDVPSDPAASFVWGLKGDDSAEASVVDLGRAFVHGIWNPEARREMEHLLERVRPDVVHLHNIFYQLSHSIVDPIRKRGIPIVLTLHDYHPVCASNYLYFRGRICEDCKRGIHHILANRCFHNSIVASSMAFLSMALRTRQGAYLDQVAHVVSPSRFLLDKILEFGIVLPSHSVLPVFYEVPPTMAPSPPGNMVLYLGQFLEQKGVRDVLMVAARSALPFVFAGRGPLQREIEQAARRRTGIRCAGFVSGDAMERLLADALCLVVPSRWFENAPAVILDAYARRRPVVATVIGGIPELVEDGVTGILVPAGDLDALLAAVEQLSREHGRAAAMGEAGWKRLAQRHSLEAYLDQMDAVYRDVVG